MARSRYASVRGWMGGWPRNQPAVLMVVVGAYVLYAVTSGLWPRWVPTAAAVLLMLVAAYLLQLRYLLASYVVLVAAVATSGLIRGADTIAPGAYVVLVVTGLLLALFVRAREALGVRGNTGQTMLVDLRDRLRSQGRVPELPPQWQVDRTLRSAYGDSFSGDFLVASRSAQGTQLEMVLVDVSGKGQAAGTRALLLSGAFGGLLGAMPQGQFMAAANTYLLRQRWHEGFATAVHLALDLDTGDFSLSSAGHPPAAHYHAGSGRWDVVREPGGPALGIIDEAEFPAHTGRLERGDALLLYTDGLVETPGRDLELGIDRLMGQAERMVSEGAFRGGADRIVDGTRTGESDDRALVLIWRE